jgi:hypothetical protein
MSRHAKPWRNCTVDYGTSDAERLRGLRLLAGNCRIVLQSNKMPNTHTCTHAEQPRVLEDGHRSSRGHSLLWWVNAWMGGVA